METATGSTMPSTGAAHLIQIRMWPNNMAAPLAGIPFPRDRRMRGSSKARRTGRRLAREIVAVRTHPAQARIQQTGQVRMPVQVQVTQARTEAAMETILVTVRFQIPTHR